MKVRVKSPSQKLRLTLWIFWNRSNKSVDFEQFYERSMARLNELVSGLLLE